MDRIIVPGTPTIEVTVSPTLIPLRGRSFLYRFVPHWRIRLLWRESSSFTGCPWTDPLKYCTLPWDLHNYCWENCLRLSLNFFSKPFAHMCHYSFKFDLCIRVDLKYPFGWSEGKVIKDEGRYSCHTLGRPHPLLLWWVTWMSTTTSPTTRQSCKSLTKGSSFLVNITRVTTFTSELEEVLNPLRPTFRSKNSQTKTN